MKIEISKKELREILDIVRKILAVKPDGKHELYSGATSFIKEDIDWDSLSHEEYISKAFALRGSSGGRYILRSQDKDNPYGSLARNYMTSYAIAE